MPFLSEADRRALLRLAHQAVAEAVSYDRLPERIPSDGVFGERRGVFVTLQVRARLHGCIGVIEAHEPLGESIVRCAASAALQDRRFPRMRPDQLPDLQIEISLLSPPTLTRPEAIQIGYHGLLIAYGAKQGILLPQVATRHHFTAEEFLEETCKKAELPPRAWIDPEAQLFGFTCEVFSDADFATALHAQMFKVAQDEN
jgi:AmmeMemoRadiSam system protein A